MSPAQVEAVAMAAAGMGMLVDRELAGLFRGGLAELQHLIAEESIKFERHIAGIEEPDYYDELQAWFNINVLTVMHARMIRPAGQ